MRPRRVLQNPTVEPEPFDTAAFPGVEERLRADGGAASERWRDLIATTDGPGRRGDGHHAVRRRAEFGDPPEVWNLTHPDVVRQDPPRLPRRGLADPHDEHLRGQSAAARACTTSRPGRRAQPDRRSAAPRRGRCGGGGALVAGDIGPTGAIMAPTGTLAYDEAGRLRRAGRWPRGRWRRPHLDRDDVRPDGDRGRDRRRPTGPAGDPADHDHDLRYPRPHDDGRSPGAGRQGAERLGRRRRRRQLRQRARRTTDRHRADARRRAGHRPRRQIERRDAGTGRHAGRLPADPATMATAARRCCEAGATIIGGCCGNTPEHLAAIASRVARLTSGLYPLSDGPSGPGLPGPSGYDTPAMTDPTPSLATAYRTHTCGELRAADAGTVARLAGWVNRRRDHGQLIFIDLRDRHGMTQVVIDADGRARRRTRWPAGPHRVRRRPSTARSRCAAGHREREAADGRDRAAGDRGRRSCPRRRRRRSTSTSRTPRSTRALRLKYRYLDMRREPMQQRMLLRSRLVQAIREVHHATASSRSRRHR